MQMSSWECVFSQKLPHEHVKKTVAIFKIQKKEDEGAKKKDGKRFKIRRKWRALKRCKSMIFLVLIWQRIFIKFWKLMVNIFLNCRSRRENKEVLTIKSCLTSFRRIFNVNCQLTAVMFRGWEKWLTQKCFQGEKWERECRDNKKSWRLRSHRCLGSR